MGPATRQQLGAWYTPPDLVRRVVEALVTDDVVRRSTVTPQRVLDPACGDGRFLAAVADRITSGGGQVELVGVDIDRTAVAAARAALSSTATIRHADALGSDWSGQRFDVVVANPPFLSQMSSITTRRGASDRGGGPYADAAAEFLALAADVVEPDGGRIGFVLPQSLLSARDAGPIRRRIDERAQMTWSWWSGERAFDAHVVTCAVVFEFGSGPSRSGDGPRGDSWSHVVTTQRSVPEVPAAALTATSGVLGDRARLNANFRDEYYGMAPAVGDHLDGPRLVTSGLIDPLRCRWGERPIRFAKRRLERPRLDLEELDDKMRRWARQRLVPKVLVANQTAILEAIVDADATMLPGVPVVAAYPHASTSDDTQRTVREIAALLTSPVASAWVWARSGGTGLSANTIRVGPALLAELPWPSGCLDDAVAAVDDGDARRCARAVHVAFGIDDDELFEWWEHALTRIESRH